MYKLDYSNWHPLKKSIMFVVLAMFCLVLLYMPTALVYKVFFNIEIEDINNASIVFHKILQGVSAVGLFLLPAILFKAVITDRHLYKYDKLPTFGFMFFVVIIVFLSQSWVQFFSYINVQIPFPEKIHAWIIESENYANVTMERFLKMASVGDFAINLFLIAVIPALGEEFFFRGVLQKYMIQWTRHTFWGIMITAAIFSAFHFQFLGFIPRMFLGVLFGYIYVVTSNIWLPVLAHFINNSLGIAYVYFMQSDVLETIGNQPEKQPLLNLLITGFFIVGLFYIMIKKNAYYKSI